MRMMMFLYLCCSFHNVLFISCHSNTIAHLYSITGGGYYGGMASYEERGAKPQP
jgi:hypothetical protein